MDKPKYVYVIYINSTPEKVWNAISDPEMTKQYWGRGMNISDWKAGSTWEHRDYDDKSLRVSGKVIESVKPSRLVLTWEHEKDLGKADRTSRVTLEIEPFMDSVKLTVIHEDLTDEAFKGVSQGWPAVLSSLKTLLESGKPLEMTTKRWACK